MPSVVASGRLSAGVNDLRPSEGQSDESVRVQLAGAAPADPSDARPTVGRAYQSELDRSSLAAVEALR